MAIDLAPNVSPILRPPRGAAIAGVIFAVLLTIGLGLVRYAAPDNPAEPGVWMTEPSRREQVRIAITLVPFAGIAFLWFMGVLRNRMGQLEDQFFATVFLASGWLFVATLFIASAVTDALIDSLTAGKIDAYAYYFGLRLIDKLLNLFAMKMAGVFIFCSCTIGLRTGIFPRWVAFLGYGCGLALLLIIANWKWITLIFPGWVLVLSIQILAGEITRRKIVSDR